MVLANLGKTFFTDEKIFKLEAPNNKQNSRIYWVNLSCIKEKSHSKKSQFPITIMAFSGISKLGKTFSHFVTKINSVCYCNEVLSQLPLEMEQLSNGDQMVIKSSNMELIHTYQKFHLLTWWSIAVNDWNQISCHLKALTSILVIMLSGIHQKPKSWNIISFKSQLMKFWKNTLLKCPTL